MLGFGVKSVGPVNGRSRVNEESLGFLGIALSLEFDKPEPRSNSRLPSAKSLANLPIRFAEGRAGEKIRERRGEVLLTGRVFNIEGAEEAARKAARRS